MAHDPFTGRTISWASLRRRVDPADTTPQPSENTDEGQSNLRASLRRETNVPVKLSPFGVLIRRLTLP